MWVKYKRWGRQSIDPDEIGYLNLDVVLNFRLMTNRAGALEGYVYLGPEQGAIITGDELQKALNYLDSKNR